MSMVMHPPLALSSGFHMMGIMGFLFLILHLYVYNSDLKLWALVSYPSRSPLCIDFNFSLGMSVLVLLSWKTEAVSSLH
jgi:hypothetical protein